MKLIDSKEECTDKLFTGQGLDDMGRWGGEETNGISRG
jgi:hypothetical protein